MIWEVKVGMYFLGGFGGTIRKYPRAKQSLDSNTNSLENLQFSLFWPNFELEKIDFFQRYENLHEMRSCNEPLFQEA